MARDRKVIIKSPQQISAIRESGKYLTELLYKLYDQVQAWVVLMDLEKYAQTYLDERKLKWAFKWYEGYPANLCLSVNDCVVHGIPNNYVLKVGDLLKIDSGVLYKGGISDAAISVVVGGEFANPEAFELMTTTKAALDAGIQQIKPNNRLFDYSSAVFQKIRQGGFSVLENLTGHGVGQLVHEAPHIYNYPHPHMKKQSFLQHMVIALEPIIALNSTTSVEKPGNHRNLYTKHGDIGAQWEYTVVVTEKGNEILAWVTEDLW